MRCRLRIWTSVALLTVAWGGCAMVLEHRLRARHPGFQDSPTLTQTKDGSPGDALNIALIGAEEELVKAMLTAGWYPADPVTLKSSLRIGWDTLFHRRYQEAPVSSLFVWQRKQDLAFEQLAGHSPGQRHHVRFWRSARLDEKQRPLWFGAATYDRSVGLSHRTGRLTHHIGAEIDLERDKLMSDLLRAEVVESVEWIEAFQPQADGRNGGGDRWRTDRRLSVATLRES